MRSWFLLFSCNFMWALQFTCVKLVQDQVGPLFTVWAPMTLATVMIYPLLKGESQQGSRKQGSDIVLFLVLAVVGVFPGQVFITWGTRMSLASNAALLMLTLPVSTAFLAFLFLHEKMTLIRWVSFGVAIIGVAMCSGIDLGTLNFGKGYLLGNLLILLGTFGSAFYNSYGKKVLERYSPTEMLFYTYVAMFFLMTPLTLAKEPNVFAAIPHFSSQTWIGLALLTFFHNYLSMVLFLKALKQLDAIQAALSNYLITFFGVPIASIWLKEKLTLMAMVGGILILGSTILITVWDTRQVSRKYAAAPASQ
jgi:drug/metabolite transporter (DMT)-like permease